MIATSQSIAGPAAYSPEWYAFRKFDPSRATPVVIGGSNAAAALGVDRYTSPLELYLRLRGELPEKESNPAMEFGRRVERVVLDWYAEDEGASLEYEQPLYLSAAHPFMGVTPDALRVDTDWGVDAKASRSLMRDNSGDDEHKYGEPGTDQVPVYNLCQAQQYCAVLGVDRVDFPVLFDGSNRQTYFVDRNPDLVASLIAAEKELFERVVNNDPPEPSWEMSGTNKILQRIYGFEPNKKITLSDRAIDLWNRKAELQDQKKRIEEEIEGLKNRVLAEMAGAEIGVHPSTGTTIKRIRVKGSTYQVTREPYEYTRRVNA